MADFKIRENFTDGSTQNFYVSAGDEATALGIANSLFGGNHEALEKVDEAVVPTTDALSTAVAYKIMGIRLTQDDTEETTFLTLYVDSSKDTIEVINTLKGKSINGVRADTVSVFRTSFVDVA